MAYVGSSKETPHPGSIHEQNGSSTRSCEAFSFQILWRIGDEWGAQLVQAELTELFIKEYGRPPEAVSSAPGILHLLGEHAEFAKGHVLSFALPQRAWIVVSRRDDSSVRMFTTLGAERKRCGTSNLKFKKEDRWANLIKGVLAGLDTLGCIVKGVNVLIHSEIPDGRGLGASSAISIASTLALCRLFSFTITDAQVVYVAHTAETQFIGRPNRVSTCYASLHAHAGACFSLDLRSLEYRHIRINASGVHFYLIDSMVPPLGALEELQERAVSYGELRNILRMATGKKEVRDIPYRELKEVVSGLPEMQRRVAIHIAGEEERHHIAVDALEAGNTQSLGKILHRSHESLRDNYEISCPELDWLSKHETMALGMLGTRLTGRGFGACAVMLLKGEIGDIEHSLKQYLIEYERIFGFQAKASRVVVSEGARDHMVNPGHGAQGG